MLKIVTYLGSVKTPIPKQHTFSLSHSHAGDKTTSQGSTLRTQNVHYCSGHQYLMYWKNYKI